MQIYIFSRDASFKLIVWVFVEFGIFNFGVSPLPKQNCSKKRDEGETQEETLGHRDGRKRQTYWTEVCIPLFSQSWGLKN